MEKAINEIEPDYIFHLAAAELDANGDIETDLKVNAISVLYLLKTCIEKKCYPKIIFSSSTNIFGNVNSDVVNENTKSNPPAEWSAHKLLAENYIKKKLKRIKIKYCIGRIFSFTHKNQDTSFVVPNLYKRIKKSKGKKKALKNLNHFRDFISVNDICNAIELIIKKESMEILKFFIFGNYQKLH